ncbi:MAG: metallophosphatase, partial [Candidatus Heimdallarchaeota archaeon]|nr:metallophosphatase [Candidatus Heimdallarchaeota archaeon]MCK5049427.1 metallophosphatase [Candidatus Heimdallarchaeota archaeon]
MKVIYNKKSVILVTIILSSLLNYNQSFAIVEEEKQLSSTDEITTLTILHINDLHGWLNPRDGYGGMATLMGYFEGREGYTKEDDSYLLLSGGDQNTGPAVATLSKGIAVVDTMNEMGFDAAAIGNHEFDFGTDWMNTRQDMASYPILSSNIFEKGTSNLADFAIPYVIQNHSGVAVGIIGLTTTTSSTTSHPKITQDFDFGDYEEALRANIDDVKAAGAEVIIALTHVTPEVLIQIATYTEDLGINLFLGGHGGTPQITEVGSSVVAMA